MEHATVFPASTVAALKAQLQTAPAGTVLRVTGHPGHLFLQLVPPAHAAPTAAAAAMAVSDPMVFPMLNDSFPCPGSPGCPQ